MIKWLKSFFHSKKISTKECGNRTKLPTKTIENEREICIKDVKVTNIKFKTNQNDK